MLHSEHMAFSIDDDEIVSTSVPLPILSIDKRQYSKNNWVGINPFVILSNIAFSIKTTKGATKIQVRLNTARSWILYSLIVLLVSFVATAIPNLFIGICLFIFFSILTWLIIFKLHIYLIINEINKFLRPKGGKEKDGVTS